MSENEFDAPPPAEETSQNVRTKTKTVNVTASPPKVANTTNKPKQPTILKGRAPIFTTFPHQSEAPPNVLFQSLRVHPKGFRLLKANSPLERRMNTYFRLPPKPNKVAALENTKLQRELRKHYPPPGVPQGRHHVALDGFILLEASQVQDPADAKECVLNDSNLSGSATEDLPFFVNLRFLDLGENHMTLDDLKELPALEEIHLHCNGITSLEWKKNESSSEDAEEEAYHGERAILTQLTTLNLSFNSIPPRDVLQLSRLHSLERLDLSCNNLRRLPKDLSSLINVSHLALENNKFSDSSVLLALSTMPSLLEVNLNYNQFASVPRLSVTDGSGVCFPLLEVIGLASNNIEFFEDVYALTQLTTLKRVVLWGNAVERKRRDCEILVYEFGVLRVQVVLESPIPPKRKLGEFCAANTRNFVMVSDADLQPIPAKGCTVRKPTTAPANLPEEEPAGGPSFFVTQVGLETNNHTAQPTSGGGDGTHASEQQQGSAGRRGRRPQHAAQEESWFSARGGGTGGGAEDAKTATRVGSALPQDDEMGGGTSSPLMHPPTSPEMDHHDVDWGNGAGRGSATRPNANVRSVMAELKRMLRQPLPPINQPSFQNSTKAQTSRKGA